MKKEEVRDFWDKVAVTDGASQGIDVGTLHKGNELQAFYRRRSEEMFLNKFLSIGENRLKVLEIGTGGGRWAIFLARQGHMVTALDISEQMIQVAKNNFLNSGLDKIDFIVADPIEFLNEKKEKFDLIYFSGMLMYLSDGDLAKILSLSKQRLTNNGRLLARETLVTKQRFVSGAHYPALYRTRQEYESIAQTAQLNLNQVTTAYEKMRFSGIISKLYLHKILGMTTSNILRKFLQWVVTKVGDPKVLMNQITVAENEKYGEKVHCFLVFE